MRTANERIMATTQQAEVDVLHQEANEPTLPKQVQKRTLVSVAVPYSSVPQTKSVLYPLARQKRV